MSSKIKDELNNELKRAYKLEESETRRALLLSLFEKLKEINDDKDIHNYIWANRDLPLRMFTNKELQSMPKLASIWTGNADTGAIDYAKDFGEDWENEFESIPLSKIQFIADKYGRDARQMINEMAEQATKQRRKDIANDGSAAGYVTKFVAPRAVEAVERGESPSGKDVVLDVAENVAYAAPWATVFKPFARLGNAGRIAQGTAGNALTPTIMETADAIAYDDSNPRGNFSPTDVATQTAVNATTPLVLRSLLRGAGRFVNSNKLANKFDDFATADRTTRSDITSELRNLQKEAMVKAENAKFANNYTNPPLKTRADKLLYSDKDVAKKDILNKLNDYAKELEVYKKIPTIKPSTKFTDEEVKLIATDPDLQKFIYMDVNYPQLLNNERLAKEEAIKNYLTNQFGSYWYDEQSPWTRIPVAGQAINKYFKDKEESAKRKATESRILDTLRAKYGDLR